jgi:hypothetical protein
LQTERARSSDALRTSRDTSPSFVNAPRLHVPQRPARPKFPALNVSLALEITKIATFAGIFS